MNLSVKENEFGLCEAEMAWIAKRAAKHHSNGATMREAIGMALVDLTAFYAELAHAKTPRAKATLKSIATQLYYQIRGEKAPEALS